MPLPSSKARSEFFGRLAYYMIGISIGLVMLGLWQMQRRSIIARGAATHEAQRAEAIRQQEQDIEARLNKPPAPAPSAPPASAPLPSATPAAPAPRP